MYTHSCIKKCGTQYQSEDPEPYYCEACNTARLAIAKELDKKVRPVRPVKSALQEYDEARKINGFVQVKL